MTLHEVDSRRTHRSSRVARAAVAACATAALAATLTAPAFAAARPAVPAAAHHGRGALLAVTPVAELDKAAVSGLLTRAGIGDGTVRHGVRAWRLTYRTVDTAGRPTTATGLLTLPTGGERRLDLVADAHGTMVHRDYAPSVTEGSGKLFSYLHGSAGRAVAAPDYLGLGKGPGTHPYMDTRSAVTASLDMLSAARTAAQRLHRPLTGDVYATGFSQGGQVTMALGRELSEGHSRGFRLRALAPVAGPYDLVGQEVPALYDGRVNDTSALFYVSYFLVAQNRLHPIYSHPSEAFRAPYDQRIEALFDGEHREEDVIAQLPKTVKELLTPAFYERMRHPDGALLTALKSQDGTCDWKPKVPVRLYASAGDTDVPIGNAHSCAADLAAHGVRAPVLDQGDVDHFGSFRSGGPKAVRWFDRLAR
ncbi:alpha/beta hydrolase [Streptomyces sp. TRM66268-LWL]|uniref:Alpha/beta hydrolase n=1 Tax=Streptomyces polyasparticus TaxID=2767826 RepID=A0ABR7SDW5_9ACTN|nr:alpha/beta hydrolase [Streptomyces polyasparticus]MBC9712528.1 alpha/beta hydrolase [Streptomyces polyasparticus]